MLEKGDLVTLKNNSECIVVNTITLEHQIYVYLISKDGISDVKICKYENNYLNIVEDKDLFVKLIKQFSNLN